jgi:alanyl-tRNA synthetase
MSERPKRTSAEIREDFFRFFEGKGHTRVPSAPVAPSDDPTLLFTNAGMNQFKDVFLGAGRRDYVRAVDTQKCIRVSGKHNDLEEVGFSPRHHTFFEMLGNWSFGDYFKREAIAWGWELLTEEWRLPKDRLWATVFGGDEADGLEPDEEAEQLWREVTDIRPDRVIRLGKKDNFWEMGETGPCGPCSEIHYYRGNDPAILSAGAVDVEADGFLELWNLVFIQFNRDGEGLHNLPAVHVDTGMGLERACAVLQDVDSNYDTDLFLPLLAGISDLTGKPYTGEYQVAMRVIADHVRALTFAIAEGALPSNEGRGYVLRRILRRAARYGRTLDMQEPFIHRLTRDLVGIMGGAFPEVAEKAEHVSAVIRAEEEGFGRTLDRGLEIFDEVAARGAISGEDAFRLYDTYGFPLDLTQLMAAEKGLAVDEEGFQREMDSQRTRSREATKNAFSAQQTVAEGFLPDRHSEFVGYETLQADTRAVAWREGQNDTVEVFLERTPFYSESGGQIGDRGCIRNDEAELEVEDTVRIGEGIVHRGRLVRGTADGLTSGQVTATVDAERRLDTARNHTATHLVHMALRRVLGSHVDQAGSMVAPDRMRFDFTHFTGVTAEQLEEIEAIANGVVLQDLAVDISLIPLDKAREMGATMLFTEKYGEIVRMVRVGDVSIELCGGTHVESTGQIGMTLLTSETGVAAGVRRIEVVTGQAAETWVRSQRHILAELEEATGAATAELPERVAQMIEKNRVLERELQTLRQEMAGSSMDVLVKNAGEVDGICVVRERVEPADMDSFRDMGDKLRDALGSGVGVLGAELDGKASLIAVVTDDLIQRGVQAGNVVREVAKVVGGGGGGRPHLAQAGGRDPGKMAEALELVPEIVRAQLGG